MPSDIGVKFEATGEASLSSAVRAVSEQIKALDAGMKAATAEMQTMGASEEAAQKRNELLNQSIEAGRQKLELLSKQYQNATTELDRLAQNLDKARESNDPVAIERAEKAYNQQQITVAKLSTEMSKTEQAIANNNREMQQAETQTGKTGSVFDSLKEKIGDLASQMNIKLAQEAIGNVVSGMEKLASKCIDIAKGFWDAASDASVMADDLLTLATQTGLSTKQLQEYGYASRFVDTEVSTLTGSMTKLLKSMTSSSKDTAAAFDRLSVSTTDSNGNLRDSEKVFWECIDALGKVKSETERDSLAMQIFGRSAKELNPLISAGSQEWERYCKEAREAGLVLSDDGVNALGSFNDGLQRIDATMSSARDQIMAALAPAFETIATKVADAAQQFTRWIQTDQAQAYLSQLSNIIITLADSFLRNLGPAVQKAIEIFNNVGGVIQFVTEHIDVIVGAIKAFVATLGTLKVAMVGLQIAQVFTNPLSATIAVVTAVGTAVVALAKACGISMDDVKGFFTKAWEKIKAVWTAVEPFFRAIWLAIKIIFSVAEAVLSGFFSAAWNAIKTTWSAVTGFFQGVWNGIKNAFSSAQSTLSSIFTGAWNAIRSAWSGVTGFFQGIWSGIQSAFSSAQSTLSSIFTGAWNAIRSAWSGVTGFFQGIWSGIQSAFSSAQSTLSSIFTGAWNAIRSAWSGVTGFFQGIWNGIRGAFSSVQSVLSSGFTGAWNAIRSAWSGVTSFFSGVVSNISRAFQQLPSSMSSIGKNIVQGLWNGINSMVGWITKKVKGFTDSVVGKFKDFFGIKSPSTVMRDQVGKYIGQGVGEGISSQAGYIQNAVEDVMPTITMPGMTIGSAAGMAAATQQPIILQVDGQTFARLVTPYIDKAQGARWQSLALA